MYTHTYSKTNIHSRCCDLKHTSCADFHVSQPAANTKAIQKLLSFSKRTQSAIQLLQGGQQNQPVKLCTHRSS